jgi:hypothetical protein
VPYRKDVARWFMREQGMHVSDELVALHTAAIDELLTVKVLELRYTDLDWAVERLKTLVREGR